VLVGKVSVLWGDRRRAAANGWGAAIICSQPIEGLSRSVRPSGVLFAVLKEPSSKNNQPNSCHGKVSNFVFKVGFSLGIVLGGYPI